MKTIQLFPSTFLILFVVLFGITTIIYFARKKSKVKIFYIGIIELYFLLLFSIVILPIRIMPLSMLTDKMDITNFFQIIPFHTIIEQFNSEGILSVQLIGNVLIMMPFPILIGYLIKEKNFCRLVLGGLVFSLGIESIQLIIDLILRYPSRKFDIDDVILNLLGVVIGALIYIFIRKLERFYNWVGEKVVWKI